MASAPGSTISSVQYLRGIAALMVVLLHLQVQQLRLAPDPVELYTLSAGVDIFFVISGFIMWVTTAARPQRTAQEFMRDRLIRIVPLYWIVTGTMLVIVLIFPRVAQTAIVEPLHVLSSFLFLPAINPAGQDYTPLLIPGWSLNYEMFFYLIFAAAMYLGGTNLRTRALWIAAAFVALLAIGQLLSPAGVLGFYTADIVLNFVLGVGVSIAYLSGAVRRSAAWWLLVAAGFVLLGMVGYGGLNVDGRPIIALAATAIVFGAVHTPQRPPNRPLLLLGNWSYSLYLIHPLVLSAAYQAWRLTETSLPLVVFSIGAVGLCIAAAALSFEWIERPVTAALKSRGAKHPANTAPFAAPDLVAEEGLEPPTRGL